MDNNQVNSAPGNLAVEIPPEIKNFLETLLSDSGMTNLDEEMQNEMIKELYARLDNYITSAIVKNMPPENLEEFIKLNEENKPKDEIENYIKEKMPNAGEVFAQAFSEFRELYLGNVAVARNAPEPEQTPAQQANPEPAAPIEPVVPAAPAPAAASPPVQEPEQSSVQEQPPTQPTAPVSQGTDQAK